jgi:hypothetical protein
MAIIAQNKTGGTSTPIEAGTYVARCYSMIYMGTIPEEFQGQKKDMKKVRITWELPTELKVFKAENGEQPQVIGKEFTLSMHEKGTLRKMLQSWRGKAFTEDEAASFDITKLLGKPCMLSIVHKQSKTGNTYAEIATISPLMKGMTCPEQINQSFEFNVLEFNEDSFKTLPDFIKDKVKKSAEYLELMNPQPAKEANAIEDESDDLPF